MNPFLRREKLKAIVIEPRDKVELVTYYPKEHITYVDPEDSGNFIREIRPEVFSRVKLNEQIRSFKSDVDLKTLIAKVQTPEEMNELVNQMKLGQDGQVFDETIFEGLTALQAEQLIKRGEEAWAKMPIELKGDLTKEEFLASMTNEKIRAYVEGVIAAQNQQAQKEGEE